MQEQISYVKVKDLKLNDRNPRKNDAAVEVVAKSIEKYGFKNPCIIDKDNVVWCGNTRLKAARRLGIEEVPCIVVEDLTEEQIREYALLDNKTNEIAEWDYDLLAEELQELDLADFDLDWGVNCDVQEKEVEEDNYEIPDEIEPRVKSGELWQLGRHRLMCGDSTKSEDVEKLMGGELADLVLTDPPYNVAIENSQGMTIENDNMESGQFNEFLTAAFENMNQALKAGGSFYVWYASREHINFETALNKAGLNVRQQLIWNKNSLILGRQDYHWKHEPCLYGWKEGASHYFIDDRTQSTVFEDKGIDIKKLKKAEAIKMLQDLMGDKISTTVINEDKPSVNDLHPTMKPIKLMAILIKNSSKIDETVLDLFGGSGSTLIACEQTQRKCYTMEYDEKYATVIVDRWEQFTGQKATKLN